MPLNPSTWAANLQGPMHSNDEDHLERQLSSEHSTSSWDHKPQAIVYDPSMDTFKTEECGGEYKTLATE